ARREAPAPGRRWGRGAPGTWWAGPVRRSIEHLPPTPPAPPPPPTGGEGGSDASEGFTGHDGGPPSRCLVILPASRRRFSRSFPHPRPAAVPGGRGWILPRPAGAVGHAGGRIRRRPARPVVR